MNKRAATRYLDSLFGRATGHVSVAYKDKGESWQETQFAWPKDKTKLLGWAEVHSDANIFICPALRQNADRRKGDGKALRWLWADVDMDKVPEAKRDDVRTRIKELGTLVVASGSGENRHVYVRLAREVSVAEHLRLNTGLRDYLYADNKQSDNSLLRLPGTTNWKTEQGSLVKPLGGVVRAQDVTPEALLAKRTFSRVSVGIAADVTVVDWTESMPEGLPRRVLRMVQMTPEEGKARYGSRHGAVWAIAGELHKRGLSTDEVHTVMDEFPPGVDKQEEENGYDLHKDVEKRLIWDRANIPSLGDPDDEMDVIEDAGEIFEELTPDQMMESIIEGGKQKELLRRAIRRAADAEEATSGYTSPPPDTTTNLSDALNNPPAPVQWLIEGMCSADATVVITGQYKTGKTKIMVASLISSLVDNQAFLGAYPVHVPEGGAKVGHWNLEMSALDLIDKYMRPVGYQRPENIKIANWRGYSANLMTNPGRDQAVEWLMGRDVWTIDSWTALCRSCGVDPNSGKEVGMLLGRIEEIKQLAGVRVCFFLAHTTRANAESERPGTRGASELDDHVDSRWMLTVDKSETRFIQVQGRDTQVNAMSLDFDEGTGRSTLGATSRASAAQDGMVQLVVATVKAMGDQGINQRLLVKKMQEVKRMAADKAKEYIIEAEKANFIRIEEIPTGRGRPAKMHFLVKEEKPEGDRRRRATPRDVNMAAAFVRRRN